VRGSRLLAALAAGALSALAAAAIAAPAFAGAGITTVTAGGVASLGGSNGAQGVDGIQYPEFPGGAGADAEAPVDRSLSAGAPSGPTVGSGRRAKSNPELGTSFTGITHRDQRLASGGNQFSLEPPDQGLCVGNGYVLETVNDAMRVFDTAGKALTGTTALNAFYGYPFAINRTTGVRGPFVTDPSCLFDADSQRWYHVVLTLEVDPSSGAFLGPNHLDIAVSRTASPIGQWNTWHIPVEGDCANAANYPCLGDYPHIGIDKYGFYITTNSYPFFTNGFDSAWIYAISKAQLASGSFSIRVVRQNTAGLDKGNPGFTVLPASGGQEFDISQGGTQWFASSNAAEEANGNYTSSQVLVWSLSNTSSLATAAPALKLSHATLAVGKYSLPPAARQKSGAVPLADCLNDASCSKVLLGKPNHFKEVEGPLDSSDTRMLGSTFAQGKLWAALVTGVNVSGDLRAGIEWFVIDAKQSSSGVSATVNLQGYLALAGADLIYPAVAVTPSGRGVLGFTLSGTDYFPSQGYAGIDAIAGVGDAHVAAAGLGAQDGFTEYKAYGNPPRPRWGDYGAAAVDGDSIWIANEWISAPGCSLAQYQATGFSCGGTRTTLANWSTRISKVTP
jgi:hypothetical protein